MKRLRIVNLALAALIALAGWRTFEVWRRPVPVVDPGEAAPMAKPGDGLPAPIRKPALPQIVSVVYEKDLFDVSRKAQEDAPPPPEKTPGPPPPLKLTGVIHIGTEREAVFTDLGPTGNNKQVHAREGEEVRGHPFRVTRIGPQEVALVGEAGEEVNLSLELEKGKGPKKGFGPAGKPVPRPSAGPQGQEGGQVASPAQAGAQPQPPAAARSFGPLPPGSQPPQPANDPRKRAQEARDRLKRLRDEAKAGAQ